MEVASSTAVGFGYVPHDGVSWCPFDLSDLSDGKVSCVLRPLTYWYLVAAAGGRFCPLQLFSWAGGLQPLRLELRCRPESACSMVLDRSCNSPLVVLTLAGWC